MPQRPVSSSTASSDLGGGPDRRDERTRSATSLPSGTITEQTPTTTASAQCPSCQSASIPPRMLVEVSCPRRLSVITGSVTAGT